jgi:hypothetical protein
MLDMRASPVDQRLSNQLLSVPGDDPEHLGLGMRIDGLSADVYDDPGALPRRSFISNRGSISRGGVRLRSKETGFLQRPRSKENVIGRMQSPDGDENVVEPRKSSLQPPEGARKPSKLKQAKIKEVLDSVMDQDTGKKNVSVDSTTDDGIVHSTGELMSLITKEFLNQQQIFNQLLLEQEKRLTTALAERAYESNGSKDSSTGLHDDIKQLLSEQEKRLRGSKVDSEEVIQGLLLEHEKRLIAALEERFSSSPPQDRASPVHRNEKDVLRTCSMPALNTGEYEEPDDGTDKAGQRHEEFENAVDGPESKAASSSTALPAAEAPEVNLDFNEADEQSEEVAEVKVDFKGDFHKHGEIGFEAAWTTGVVSEVTPGSQSDKKGVKVGWQVCKLWSSQRDKSGEKPSWDYSKDKLEMLTSSKKNFSVTFRKTKPTNDVIKTEVTVDFKVDIKNAGEIGIEADWTTGVVSDIIPGSQAEKKGVQVGWEFCKLFASSRDKKGVIPSFDYSKKQFDKTSKKDFSVTFKKDKIMVDFKIDTQTAGEIGIEADWTLGIVSGILPGSQAEKNGVQVGWHFYELFGISEKSGNAKSWDYSKKQLDKILEDKNDFSISFRMPKDDQEVVPAVDYFERYKHREYSIREVLKDRELANKKPEIWTQTDRFSGAIGVVIILNAILIGAEADYADEFPLFFEIVEYTFASIFVIELILHLVFEKGEYFKDKGNWLDFTLVVITIVDVFVINILVQAGVIGGNLDLRLMSLLRILRLARLARLLRLVRIFKELTMIIQGFVNGARSLAWATGFLFIIVYVFAIFARQQIGMSWKCPDGTDARSEDDDCPDGEPEFGYIFNEEIGNQTTLFGSIPRTTLTLFVCLSEGCGMDVVHPTVRQTPFLSIFWLFFLLLATFGVLNLIIGLFCEHSAKIANETERDILKSQDELLQEKLEALKAAFVTMDKDKTGDITREEYLDAITYNDEIIDYMVKLGLADEKDLFDKIDGDGGGAVGFDEFFEGITLIMKGKEPALAKDIVPTFMRVNALNRNQLRIEHDLRILKKAANLDGDTISKEKEASDAQQGVRSDSAIEANIVLVPKREPRALEDEPVVVPTADVYPKLTGAELAEIEKKARKACAQNDIATVTEMVKKVPKETWSSWKNKSGEDLLTMAQKRKNKEVYTLLAKELGLLQEPSEEEGV